MWKMLLRNKQEEEEKEKVHFKEKFISPIFFSELLEKKFKKSEKFQWNFGGPNFFVESQNCPNFKSCVGNEPPRSIFLPKKQPNSKNQRILKSAYQSVTFPLWAYHENLTLTFCPKFFSWLLHMYMDFEKIFRPKCQC